MTIRLAVDGGPAAEFPDHDCAPSLTGVRTDHPAGNAVADDVAADFVVDGDAKTGAASTCSSWGDCFFIDHKK